MGTVRTAVTKRDRVVGVIGMYKAIRKMTDTDLAVASGVSQSTISRRMNNPDEFKIGELRKIFAALGVPVDERTVF